MFDGKQEQIELMKYNIIFFKEKGEIPKDLEQQDDIYLELYNSYPKWDDIKKYKDVIESTREIIELIKKQ